MTAAVAAGAAGQTETVRVDLRLRTGGALSGLVIDHNEHGLVIVRDQTPYVFAWGELKPGSAYGAKRALLVLQRGGKENLSADDHFQLGLFALRYGRKDLAANEFREAIRRDRVYAPRIKRALARTRESSAGSDAEQEIPHHGLQATNEEGPPYFAIDPSHFAMLDDRRDQVMEVYKAFGEKVQEVIGKDVVLIETDHFLIWTDWESRFRDRLSEWCESVYKALCAQFSLDPADDVFLAKCPVFCWRSKARFLRFARLFDGYSGKNAVGYTRSIEANGHVHVVLLRQGRSEADFERFACTLVHEGTHAFLHRLYTSRLLPHWVNEGYADLMAERVLGDRCPNGENARLLARQFVRYDWPITKLISGVGPIEVYQYPLAHSVIAYLEGLGHGRFAAFIRDLKAGTTLADALTADYGDMSLDDLEDGWRAAVRSSDPFFQSSADGQGFFKVRRNVPGISYRNVCGSAEQLPILEQNGQGIGVIDYDGDGLVDLFIPNGSTEARWRRRDNPGCRLFKNLGRWRFADVTERAGVRGNSWSCGAAVADYDADGDFDIYVLNWGPNVLYRNNGDGTFTNVTDYAGVADARWSSSAAFADFNGDGLLDIYVSNYVHFDYDDYPTREKDGRPCLYRNVEAGCGPWCYDGQRDTLYINTGSGRFEDRSVPAGLACTDGFRGFGVVAADFDGDRDVDVYVGCDVMPNLYLENTGGGRFVSVGPDKGGAYNLAGAHESGMGVAAADFDGSGTLDLFVTNFAGEKNTYYRNDGGMFSDASELIQFARHPIEMGWGVCARDFNQDGLIDVFVANGQIYPQVVRLDDPKDRYAQRPRLYIHNGRGLREVERGQAFGESVSFCLRGCAAADFDNDGDLDIVAVQHNGPPVFFENLSNRPGMVLELVDRRGGLSPMGARVTVRGGASYWLLPNQGYQSSHDHRLHIVPPPGDGAVLIDVLWPDGRTQHYNVRRQPHRVIHLHEGAGE